MGNDYCEVNEKMNTGLIPIVYSDVKLEPLDEVSDFVQSVLKVVGYMLDYFPVDNLVGRIDNVVKYVKKEGMPGLKVPVDYGESIDSVFNGLVSQGMCVIDYKNGMAVINLETVVSDIGRLAQYAAAANDSLACQSKKFSMQHVANSEDNFFKGIVQAYMGKDYSG